MLYILKHFSVTIASFLKSCTVNRTRAYSFQVKPDEQIEILYLPRVAIGKRKQDRKIDVLYKVNSFYIEIFYDEYRWYMSHFILFYL